MTTLTNKINQRGRAHMSPLNSRTTLLGLLAPCLGLAMALGACDVEDEDQIFDDDQLEERAAPLCGIKSSIMSASRPNLSTATQNALPCPGMSRDHLIF